MKKLQILAACTLLVPLATFAVSRQDQPQQANEPATHQADVQQAGALQAEALDVDARDVQFESDVEAEAAPTYCIFILGQLFCI